MKTIFPFVLLLSAVVFAQPFDSTQTVSLWEQGAPGFEERKDEPEKAKDYWVKNVHNPSITVFRPKQPNGSAVLIFPGGGHGILVYTGEGVQAAEYLTSLGVTAIVLKYRLFREEGSPYTIDHPKEDAVRAMRVVRSHAAEWNIDADRIGVMGFSAGGELVNMISYNDFPGNISANDPVEREHANPNFQIQIYPGPLSIPKTVDKNAIPAFLLASNNDDCCSETILNLLLAYRKAGASVEAHFYAKGDHGFNMGNRSEFKTVRGWPIRLAEWLEDYNFFKAD
ncbi:MAG: alpha/beta hydrolase [Calditrichia bacterium]